MSLGTRNQDGVMNRDLKSRSADPVCAKVIKRDSKDPLSLPLNPLSTIYLSLEKKKLHIRRLWDTKRRGESTSPSAEAQGSP